MWLGALDLGRRKWTIRRFHFLHHVALVCCGRIGVNSVSGETRSEGLAVVERKQHGEARVEQSQSLNPMRQCHD